MKVLFCAIGAVLLLGCSKSDLPATANPSPSASSSSSSSSGTLSSSSSSSGMSTSGAAVGVINNLPAEMHLTDDGQRLQTGGTYTSTFYDETHLETIYLDFAAVDYWAQLTNNLASQLANPAAESVYIAATLRYQDKVLEQVGVSFSAGNDPASSAKKSFDIDLEWLTDGQDLDGYNELRLNNAYGDPSNLREVLYSNLASTHIPNARGNFVNLVINGQNYGVYANIQKLDKDHVKEWLLDDEATRWRAPLRTPQTIPGAGLSALNNLGSAGSSYEAAYDLKFSAVLDPWQNLANVARKLAIVAPEFLVTELSGYLDIDATLWFLATENIFVDGRGYVSEGLDYYLYYDLVSQRLLPIEYDGNFSLTSAAATTWGPFHNVDDPNYPLLQVLLNIPELRQRYLAHYRTLLKDALAPSLANPKIDQYAALIDTAMAAAAVARDYSYPQFTAEVQALKTVLSNRYDYLQEDVDIQRVGVTVDAVVDSVAGQVSVRPKDDQSVDIAVNISGAAARAVNLYYGTGLMGRFTRSAMTETGEGQYTAVIPPFAKAEYVRYYIEAIADDEVGTATYSPEGAEHDVYTYQVEAAVAVTSAVVINELMASNVAFMADEVGNFGDWIELYNTSDQAVDLSGWFLSDQESDLERWAIPAGTVINGKSTLVIWADEEIEQTGGLHAAFRLSAAGESLYLITPDKAFADQVIFSNATADSSYARSPNGTGEFTWTQSPTFNRVNN